MTAMNRKQYIQENIVTDSLKTVGKGIHDFMKDDESIIDTIQNYADIAGMVPVVGNVVDLASAGVDVVQGQFGDAGMRTIQAVPGFGQAALGTKLGAKGLSKLGVLQRPTSALARATKSTPAKVISSTAPFVPGVVGGGEGDAETAAPETAAPETAAQAASDSQELIRNLQMNQVFGNKRIVKHGTLQTFESVSSDITQCIIEISSKVGTKAVKKLTGKKPSTPDGPVKVEVVNATPEKKSSVLARALNTGIGPTALLGTAFGLPLALGKLYGTDTSTPAGQGPGSKGDGDMPAQGGAANVLDRLSALYGFIPGFNPAGAALGALGRRVGA